VKGFDVDECENDEVNVGVVKSSVYQAIENEAYQKMPIGAAEFEKYVKEMHENDNHGFSLEYAVIYTITVILSFVSLEFCSFWEDNLIHPAR
jgi:hypothetical protein